MFAVMTLFELRGTDDHVKDGDSDSDDGADAEWWWRKKHEAARLVV
jgi:hypothetical protein